MQYPTFVEIGGSHRELAIREYTMAKKTKDDLAGAQSEADKYMAQPYSRRRLLDLLISTDRS